MMPCHLCGEVRELRDSHVIPKFVISYVKKISPTGYLMSAEAGLPRIRLQDGYKSALLCGDCEQLVSVLEKYFAENIFRKLVSGSLDASPVDDRVGRFVVSVSLRAVWVSLGTGDPVAHRWSSELRRLVAEWTQYIKGDSDGKGDNTHHLLFHWPLLAEWEQEGNRNMRLNLCGAVGFCIYEIYGDSFLSVFMGPVHIISMIRPTNLPVSRGTQVYPVQTLGTEEPGLGWGGYRKHMIEFNDQANEARDGLTPGQRTIVKRDEKRFRDHQ
jgi:hypothetical protein